VARHGYLALLILALLVLALARTLVDAVALVTTFPRRRVTTPEGA
jgi:hypothetical protein